MPEAPTSEPATMRILLLMAKPAAQAARPEYEFSRDITTGMSAPPMGITAITPKSRERVTTKKSHCVLPGSRQNIVALAKIPSTSKLLTIC